jgi:hypothetical protein
MNLQTLNIMIVFIIRFMYGLDWTKFLTKVQREIKWLSNRFRAHYHIILALICCLLCATIDIVIILLTNHVLSFK